MISGHQIKEKEKSKYFKGNQFNVTPHDVIEDGETTKEHKRATASELSEAKPRDSVLLSLMKSTLFLGVRRILFLSDDASVSSILIDGYPALNRPVMVWLFTMIMSTFNYFYLEPIELVSSLAQQEMRPIFSSISEEYPAVNCPVMVRLFTTSTYNYVINPQRMRRGLQ